MDAGLSQSSDYWERVFSSRPWGSYPNEELVRFVGRNFRGVDERSAVRVLEVGCGPGPNLWFLVREGFSVAGIDCSPTAIRLAGERLATEGLPHDRPRVELKVGSFTELPWRDGEFDLAVDIEALYANTMADINRSVDEIWRTLKPGGLFFGKMFGSRTTGSTSGEMIEQRTFRKPVVGPCAGNEIAHFFDLRDLRKLFKRFSSLNVDQCHRTDNNRQVHVFEWLVHACK